MAQKPKDLRDILNAANNLFNPKPIRSSDPMVAAALNQVQNIKSGTARAVSKGGNNAVKGITEATKYALGDPSKGYKDVAINTGAWLIPYGKGFKVVNSAIKGAKYYKTAKTVRGVIKLGAILAGPAVIGKGYDSVPKIVKK